MHQLITTSKCYDCGELMEGRVENYKYSECGLSSVVLKSILVFRCKTCGAVVPQITAAGCLHTGIAVHLLRKETRLSGEEVRFLRKAVGYSATELAKMAGTSKAVVSRWENHSSLGQESDRLVRLICLNKMLSDYVFCSKDSKRDESLLKAQELLASMDNTLRKIHRKKGIKKERYEIDPAELSRYGAATDDVQAPDLVPVQ
jgi:putative zinc finger/helix-turn-helix YgiT family protein